MYFSKIKKLKKKKKQNGVFLVWLMTALTEG